MSLNPNTYFPQLQSHIPGGVLDLIADYYTQVQLRHRVTKMHKELKFWFYVGALSENRITRVFKTRAKSGKSLVLFTMTHMLMGRWEGVNSRPMMQCLRFGHQTSLPAFPIDVWRLFCPTCFKNFCTYMSCHMPGWEFTDKLSVYRDYLGHNRF